MSKDESMTNILWRRLRYMLTPQADLYQNIGRWIGTNVSCPSILEVGFGTGIGTLQLYPHAEFILALEVDKEAYRFAVSNLPIPDIEWMLMDITDDKTKLLSKYNVAVMVEALEHIEQWELALSNIHNLLVPGGNLIMTARNRNADLRRNDLHEREWSAEELHTNLSKWFDKVELFDYTLRNPVSMETRITPLIAVATK